MLERVQETIARYRLCRPGQRIGVACSGGPDSVALLLSLRELAHELGVSLGVVHLNHGLRGQDSDADEAFVRELAVRHALELHCESADLADADGNLEEAGREARYRWFGELIGRNVFDRVATGHTRSDQAETVLFRILRGSGPDGLRSIRPIRAPGVIRPLLGVDRAGVETFLAERAAPYRIDESNRDARFARNRIRHVLLPQLERDWNPRVSEALARLGEQAAEDAAFWEEHTQRWELRLLRESQGGLLFDVDEIRQVEPALRRRLLRRALERVGGAGRFDFQHVEALRRLAGRTGAGARVSLPGLVAERSCGRVRLARAAMPSWEPAVLHPPSEHAAPDGRSRIRIEWESASGGPGSYTKPNWDRIDSSKAPERLLLRSWTPGDRLRLTASAEPRKLCDLLEDWAVSRWDRDRWPVIAAVAKSAGADDRIVWARGFGVSGDFRPLGNIGPALRVLEFDEAGRCWTGPERWDSISANL